MASSNDNHPIPKSPSGSTSPIAPVDSHNVPSTDKAARQEQKASRMHRTLRTMWPQGVWCPKRYGPSTISESILVSMHSLTLLWVGEGKELMDLWAEGKEPGLLVSVIRERMREPKKLSASVAREALRRANALVQRQLASSPVAPSTTSALKSPNKAGTNDETWSSVESVMTEQFTQTSLDPPTPCPPPKGLKRNAQDASFQPPKRVRTQYEDAATNVSSGDGRYPIDLTGLEEWVTRELSAQFWKGLTISDKPCPTQNDAINCGIFVVVIVACLLQKKNIPDPVDVHGFREFFASNLESGTKVGTLKISQVLGSAASSKKPLSTFSTSDDEKSATPPYKFTFPAPSTRESNPFKSTGSNPAKRNPAKDNAMDRPPCNSASNYPQQLQKWLRSIPSPDTIENRIRREIQSQSQALIEELQNEHAQRDGSAPSSQPHG
ncbi:hypothetical protein G7046_g4007 [Stylonectria norvegica]|nr:hypothetical protein G7046_g4007 [Stylonectria norvegica]